MGESMYFEGGGVVFWPARQHGDMAIDLTRGKALTACILRFRLLAAAFFSRPGQRFAVAVVDPHEVFAPLFAPPAERRLNRSAGHPGLLQRIKRDPHDRALHPGIPGLPAGVSQREVGKDEAGDAAFFHDVAGRTHDDGGHSVLFQVPGGQTHGLVANRSEG